MAAGFAAPSFSLGFDLDFDDEEQQKDEEPSITNQSNRLEKEDDSKLGETVDRDDFDEPPRPALKRLRRGPPPTPTAAVPTFAAEGGNENLDDDIEDFSSQEDGDRRNPVTSPSLQCQASCSSSKVSLRHRGILSSQSANKLKTPKIFPAYYGSASTNFEASSNKQSFPRLTISPLRKIHLVDSDSDEPSSSKGKINCKDVNQSNEKRREASFQFSIRNDKKTFESHKEQTESLWKNLSPKKNNNLATPALDEFCEEYFKSAKDQNVDQQKKDAPSFCSSKVLDPDDSIDDFEVLFQKKNNSRGSDHSWDLHHPKPPAYQYFFHNDARIRALVRERLPHFTPIGVEEHKGPRLLGEENLDYIGQFCAGEGPSQRHATNNRGFNSTSKIKQKKTSTTKPREAAQDTGKWLNPRASASMPKDAGKRRVSAVGGQGSGQWFTGQDGRKVYVSKNGQELTGRIAYRQYKMDKGTGFRKAKKKVTTEKTTKTKKK